MSNPEEVSQAIRDDSRAFAVSFALVTVIQFVFGAICVDLMNISANRQIARIRDKFFFAVLRQDISWYDTNTNMNFASQITEDLERMKDGIGEKIAIFIYLVSSFVASIIVSFVYGWELTLVVMTCAPIIIIATAVVAKVQTSLTAQELRSYGAAGIVAEEVLSSIRTVVAFGGEEKESKRYADQLIPATQKGQRKGLFSGIGGGSMWFIVYCSYALAFWYGVDLILQDRGVENPSYTPAVLIIVFFGVLSGAQNLGMTSPHLESFATARGAASHIFSVIDREPIIDSTSSLGLKPKTITGDLEFKNVHFQYPSRPDVTILRGLNLTIKSGETVALVGSSGCGKSTAVQLIQRLYDPNIGDIFLDNVNVADLNVEWLRSRIGVVGQEPVLFATTIANNIRYGYPNATVKEIETAARDANCHDFITKLPLGYETMVGDKGAQLSGGQKQRIAIARALIRKPTILLLDEATSALDLTSEAKVQKALDKARLGRTTVIVTHRLSTITNADRIVIIHEGEMVEMGTHEELLEKKGHYYNLVYAEGATAPEQHHVPRHRKMSHSRDRKVSLSEKYESSDGSSTAFSSTIDGEDTNKEEPYNLSIMRILKVNSPEWGYILVGSLSSLIVGATFPIFAVIFGEVYRVLALEDADEIRGYSREFAYWFLGVGVVTGIGTFLQTYMFNVAGVRLTTRLRALTFSAIIRQEIAWFDEQTNSVGALCSRLSGDAAAVQNATGTKIGAILQSVSTLVFSLLVGFYYSWKMAMISFLSTPLVFCSMYIDQKISAAHEIKAKESMESASKIAVEAIANIRTVASLCQEKEMHQRYLVELEKVNYALEMKTRTRGSLFSLGQSIPYLSYAISLWYGGLLIANEGLPYDVVIKVSEALIFGAWMIGEALAYTPNMNSAKLSACRIFRLLDRFPTVISGPMLEGMQNWHSSGNISYKDIEFHYPTRPNIEVLKGLNLEVKTGQTVALVGHSGCGKSTCIQLLQRLYDPDAGEILLDGKNIRSELTLPTLRSQLGLVSQEPVLFDRTIAENIAYGDNGRTVTIEEIIEVAKQANIHNFISSLPMGYDTRLGTKGAQLSGGQKQRVAIARALIRHPRVLLLDEATSALDNQSEKVVQVALDNARAGRTCITIAHRLATIQNADLICVIDDGEVKEQGTHQELITKGKLYTQLYALQRQALASTQN